MANSLEAAAEIIAKAITPFADALSTSTEDIAAFVERLGFELPLIPPAFTTIQAAAENTLSSLDTLQSRRQALEENTGSEADVLAALALVLTNVGVLASDIQRLPNLLRAQLPAPYLAATQIAETIEKRLFDILISSLAQESAPFLYDAFSFVGIFEELQMPEDPARHQPEFTLLRINWDRLPRLFSEPESIFREIYGWGTPTIDSDRLFEALRRLSAHLGSPAEINYPSQNLLNAVAPGVAISDETGPEPEFLIPVLTTDVIVILLSLHPMPKATPGEIQGLAVTLRVTGSLRVDIPISGRLGLRVESAVDLSSGLALALRPNAPPTVVLGFDGAAGPFNSGRIAVRLSYANQNRAPVRLLSAGSGSGIEAEEVYVASGVEARATDVDPFVEVGIVHGKIILSGQGSDGFLKSLLPPEGITLNFDFGLGWTKTRGVYFQGSGGLETSLPLHLTLGPITLQDLTLGLRLRPDGLQLESSVTASAKLGPISVSIERVGLVSNLDFRPGNVGPVDLQLKFKPPNGLGIAVDAGPVTGGGFITFDEPNARYAGILQLRLMEIGVTAIGLLDTRLPGGQSGYSFLIIIAVNLPPIQLSFGFVLTGIGGLAGINRTVVTDAITQGLRNGVLDHIMFPPDPIRNAPQIISDLRTIFPPAVDRYVFGPMLQLAWGTPSLIICQLGVILEVPDPVRIILIGQLKMALPSEDAALVEIHIDILGVIDFGQKLLSITGSMHDSRITIFSMYGDMAVRLFWGDPPNFALSMGGWNPHFSPPPGMPALRRLTVAIGAGDNPRITCDSYFAVTSNSFQFGAHAELYAAAGGFNVRGWIGFDALITFSPFSFIVDIDAGVQLRSGSSVIAGIHLSGHLAGPNPWHIWGEACLSLFFFDICVGFDVTVGDRQPEALPTADPWPLLEAAIKRPESWSASIPAGGARAVSLAIPSGSTPPVLVNPLGGISLHEKILPLNRKITKFGEAKPIGPDHYNVTAVRVGNAPAPSWAPVKDYFAIGQFQELSDPEKLSRPSFELMDAGVSVASDAAAHGASIGIDVVYETIIVDAPDLPPRFAGLYTLGLATQMNMTNRSAAATAASWKTGLNSYNRGLNGVKPFHDVEPTYTVASTIDLSGRFDIGQGTIGETYDALNLYLETHPDERGTLQVIPTHELEVA